MQAEGMALSDLTCAGVRTCAVATFTPTHTAEVLALLRPLYAHSSHVQLCSCALMLAGWDHAQRTLEISRAF